MEENKEIHEIQPFSESVCGDTEQVSGIRFGDKDALVHIVDDTLTIKGTNEQVSALFTDYIAYFGEVQNPENTKVNTFFNGAKYSPLNEVLNTVRPVMAKHNLSLTQLTSTNYETGIVTVTTMLMHKNGAYIIFPALSVKPESKGNPVQAVGAALTYLRRFALNAVASVCGEVDDDGNSSQAAAAPRAAKKEKTPHQKVADMAKEKSKKNRTKVAEIIKDAAGTDMIKDIPEEKIAEVLKKLEELD